MKKNRILGLVLLMILFLAGCGSTEAIKVDTLSIFRDGTATYTIISDFSEPYYDVEELKAMAQEEVDVYGTGIQISGAEVTAGVLNFQYTFDSLSHYAKFMDTSCYKSTVADALSNGYKAETRLISAKNSSNVIQMNDASIGKKNLFVWNEAVNVRCDGNVQYYSENLTLLNETDVQPKEGSTGPYYVVYK